MGRSIYCSTCKKEKEPGRDNESRCKACKSQANKEKRAKKRAEQGLLPLGSGRSPYCYICKAVKENPKEGYCLACRRKRDNEYRLANGITKKHQTGKCPCGAERAPYSKAYCIECLSKRAKERKIWMDYTDEQKERRNALQNARYIKKRPESFGIYYRSDEHRFKHQVRALTRSYVRAGKLIKMPCEKCGTKKNVEAHHDDYTKPMDIRWLCRLHHREHHKLND